jgi:hypothetical protein
MKKLQHKIKNPSSLVVFIIALLLSLIPIIAISHKIFSGGIALWYDPARDLLLGWDNLHKLTLIGPTSGIPGVFYGPYWIWLISLAQLFSKDPRSILFIVLTLPYLIFFPFILSRFSKIFSPLTIALLCLLFLLGFSEYMTKLWNPYPAPLLILFVIYLQFIKTENSSLKNFFLSFLVGFTAGLVTNFHLSFGIGMLFGLLLYQIGETGYYFYRKKHRGKVALKKIIEIGLFFTGVLFSFLPFILFEIRHQFLQTKTLFIALTHYGGVVALKGLSQIEILQLFFKRFSDLLNIPVAFTLVGFILAISSYVYFYRKRHDGEKPLETKLLLILFSLSSSVLGIYLTAKNPVWSYHFIGVEILFLLLLGIFLNRSKYFQIVLSIWVIYMIASSSFTFLQSLNGHAERIAGNLAAEEQIVKKIQAEGKNSTYVVFAYSPSIYIYEYTYLFKWLYQKDVPYDPGQVQPGSDVVYLIIPNSAKSMYNSFIEYRASSKQYKTEKSWNMSDGTVIVQRIKINK